MRRFLLTTAVVALAVSPAVALRIAMPNLNAGQKAVQADAVVTGKVTELEKEDAEVLPHQGAKDKVKMKVGVLKIDDGLIGVKNVTHLKVLFPAPMAEQPLGDQAQPLPGGAAIRPLPIRGGGFQQIALKEGDEGLFFLAKHPTAENYYVINPAHAPILVKAETFKADVLKVKAVVGVLADPLKALKADKAEDKLSAAATLIQKYRRGLAVAAKEEAIPAEETKAILAILAGADWTAAEKPQPGVVIDYQAQPQNLVSMLALYPGQNGFPKFQPKPGESYAAKYHEAFKEWLAKDGAKFEIKKFVPTGK